MDIIGSGLASFTVDQQSGGVEMERLISDEVMEDKSLNRIICKAAAMKLVEQIELDLAFEEWDKGNEKDEAFCGVLRKSIKSIKEYHNIR